MSKTHKQANYLAVVDWGRTEYIDALERQKALLVDRIDEQAPDTLLFTEHEPIFTLGMRKGAEQHLVWTEEQRKIAGVNLYQSNRGGDITYHGPGQIVAYPIISLRERKDLHAYLRDLEEVVIRTLAGFGLTAGRRAGMTGIWMETRKICALGVAVKSWVTYHGLALNVDPDLSHFSGIIPCGITEGTVTSMAAEINQPIHTNDVKSRLAIEFQEVFGKNTETNGN
ncbi:MAG: lipoyl(octanoyl) transferase LipB [Coraliomargaritaceae bacterium]